MTDEFGDGTRRIMPLDDKRMSRLQMVLVRHKEDATTAGQSNSVDDQDDDLPVHVVLKTDVAELDRADITSDMTNFVPWTTCCGIVFAPETIELVEWGTRQPHEKCVHESSYPPTFVERMHREARDWALSRDVSAEDMAASIATLDSVLAKRGRDWTRNEEGDEWTYEASFNGAFFGKRMFPRGVDIGLQNLYVELIHPGEVYMHSCGVRDGCPRHVVRTEVFPLNDIDALKRGIFTHEAEAESFQLAEMMWCLIAGDCSAITLYADN